MIHEVKKKQHACTSSGLRDHYSELFTWMVALKLLSAVTGSYSRYRLEITYPTCFT